MIQSAYPKVRLYVHSVLEQGGYFSVRDNAAHYLSHVMRLREGDAVAVFNGRDGDWRAVISAISKKEVMLTAQEQLRSQRSSPDIQLLFAPIKGARMDFIIEKATEMGASMIQPVRTDYTIVTRVNQERAHAHCVEAAEQTERQDIPQLLPIVSLKQALASWPSDRILFYGDESGQGQLVDNALATLERGAAVAYLVGPEGGFSVKEHQLLQSLPFTCALSLGPRVLRADTAVVAGLTVIQAWVGDWHCHPRFCRAEMKGVV
jgi:16S rRNA (uracil1498-N3)-methyltransferase